MIKVTFTYTEPFVLAAKIKSQKAGRPDSESGRPILLGGQGTDRNMRELLKEFADLPLSWVEQLREVCEQYGSNEVPDVLMSPKDRSAA